jgi:hypothetical protein
MSDALGPLQNSSHSPQASAWGLGVFTIPINRFNGLPRYCLAKYPQQR